MSRTAYFSVRKKNRNKRIRVFFQIAALLYLLFLLFKALFFSARYKPLENTVAPGVNTGFIALSYFGVDRGDSYESLISTLRLQGHFRALQDAGYVTVSQQDILDYYAAGKPLPEKSLFLFFEDGRRDTMFFTQPLLEAYNYRATAFTYAENLIKDDSKFLSADDLVKLSKTTYWELGSQGYRLAYINVHDRNGDFLDVLNPLAFQKLLPQLEAGRYDHYLMDFIRDKNGIPKENLAEMRKRSSGEYEKLRDVYLEKIGSVPGAYAIMHANSNYFGTNPRAGQVNAEWIRKLFKLHFNREGNCLNTLGSGVYNLTRTQVGPHWQPNHLIMKIRSDTGLDLPFAQGDPEQIRYWTVLEGAAEFRGKEIVLTSAPGRTASLYWNGASLKDLRFTAAFDRNAESQAVYLRADESLDRYVTVRVKNNALIVSEKTAGSPESVLFERDISIPGGVPLQRLNSSAQGLGSVTLDAALSGGELSLRLNGNPVAERVPVKVNAGGRVLLEAGGNQGGDFIDDAVFSNLAIYSIQDVQNPGGLLLYDLSPSELDAAAERFLKVCNRIVNWFIKTL